MVRWECAKIETSRNPSSHLSENVRVMLTWDMSRAKLWFEDANGIVSGECSQHHLYRIVKYSTFSGHPVARVFFQDQEEPVLLMFMNRLVREVNSVLVY